MIQNANVSDRDAESTQSPDNYAFSAQEGAASNVASVAG
jgi:hypothetical protein